MRFFVTYLFITLSLLTNGQGGFKRQYKLPFSLNNSSKAVFEITPNNYIMGGIVSDTLNNFTTNRLTLFGINNQGQRTWTKKYGNFKFEYLDNPFICKWFYKQGNYIYHAGCVRDSNNKYLGVFMKFDFNGDTVWQKKFYDAAGIDVIPQMVTGSIDGGFLITGFFQDWNNNTQPVLLIKTDINGNELWRKKITKTGNPVHDGKAIIQDTITKKIVIAGYQYIGTETKDNILICDSLGNKLSQHNYAGSLGGWSYDLIQTKDKKMVVVGRAIYPQTIGGNNLTRSFVVKFDVNSPSLPIWKIDNYDKLALGNTFTSVKELANENLLISGVIDTMQQNNLPTQCYNRITKINKNGNVVWNKYYNYSTNISVDNNQGIMAINLANNGDWLTAIQVSNSSPNPFFFVKYDSTGCDSTLNYCLSVGIEERKNIEEAISVYPNPIKSVINLNFSNLNLNTDKITFRVFDVAGRVVKEDEIKLESEKTTIRVNEIDKGIYFLQLYNSNKLIATKKIILE